MKDIKEYINETSNEVLTAEAFLKENDLEETFRSLIDDALYNLGRDFNIRKTPAEISEIVIKAMEKYKNFK